MKVVRHASELGSWEQATATTPPDLRGHVARITGYTETMPGPMRRVELPANQVTLIFSLGPPIAVSYPGANRRPKQVRSFVSGLHATHAVVASGGHQAGVQVALTPFGARALLGGVPLNELAHEEVDLEDVLGREAPLLVERIAEGATWEERLRTVEGAVRRRIAAGPAPSPTPRALSPGCAPPAAPSRSTSSRGSSAAAGGTWPGRSARRSASRRRPWPASSASATR